MESKFGILDSFIPIELTEMDSIRLMNRTDTKFLTDISTLETILEQAATHGYYAFEMSGERIHGYRSMYYDTPSLQMYLDHHNRRLVRQKLRTRSYVLSGQTFLELKSKNNHGRTKKKRLEIGNDEYGMDLSANDEASQWLGSRMTYQKEGMSPSLETVFSRITLVNPEMTERSTIDFNLCFNNVRKGRSADMGNLVIIEVKQDGNYPSKLRDILLENRVKAVRISKYCIGTIMTDDEIKSGRFKPKLILINKMKAYDNFTKPTGK